MTQNELYKHICNFQNEFQNRDLETYLLALLNLVEKHRTEELNAEYMLKLLKESFTIEPAEFDSSWLKISDYPDKNIFSKKFTNPSIKSEMDKSVISDKTGIDYTIAVIQFQVSELHKMKGKQLENEMRYFGVTSETGNLWYNFDPMTNLECGVRCLIDNSEEEDNEFDINWQVLGEILEMGRIYE